MLQAGDLMRAAMLDPCTILPEDNASCTAWCKVHLKMHTGNCLARKCFCKARARQKRLQESRCMYFILVPWCWWLLNTVSKPVAAVLPVATFPVFNILTVDQMYAEYFTLQGMAVTALFCLAAVGDTVSTLVPRVTFRTCALFGVRSRLLFAVLSLTAFVGALFVSNFIIAVFIMFIVDKAIRLAHKETVKNFKQLGSRRESRRSIDRSSVDTEILLEKLATSIKTLDSFKPKVKRLPSSRRASKVKRDTTEAGPAPADARTGSDETQKAKDASAAPQQKEGHQQEPSAPKRRLKRGGDVDPLPRISKKRYSVGFAELRSLLRVSPPKGATCVGNVMRDLGLVAKPRTTTSGSTSLTAEQLPSPTSNRASIRRSPRLPARRRSLMMDRRLSVLQFNACTPAQDVTKAPLCTVDAPKRPQADATAQGLAQKKTSKADNVADAPSAGTSFYDVRMSLDRINDNSGIDDGAHLLDQHEKIYLAARNAFLIAPTLMTVTATWPSLWTMPARGAFEAHFQRYGLFRSPVFSSAWIFLTLIGSVVSSTLGCAFLYAVNLHELEPELRLDLEPDIVDYAVAKLRKIGPLRQEEYLYCYWLAAYGVCFGITAVLGVDSSVGQMCVLSGMVLVTSVLASFHNREMVSRNVICGRMPWNVLLTFGGSQAITKAVQANNLVEVMFHFFDAKFWRSRSSLVSQIYLATLSGILAEMVNNVTLSRLLMPILIEIAAQRHEHPLYYAIPVALAACTNLILPISLPLIILHDVIEVPMQQLIVAGLTMKVIFVASVIISTNMLGQTLFQGSGSPPAGTSATNITLPQDIHRSSSTSAS